MIQAYEVKEIIYDLEKLGEWSEVIHPQKEGKLCQQIIGELKATMRANNLEYLTAPQIGYNKRIFCIRYKDNDYRSYINPSISNLAKLSVVQEVCYSLPEKRYIMPRYNMVEMIYYKPLGAQPEACRVFGKSAQIMHHCVDHLDGLLTCDIGLEIDELFDQATDDERAEVVKAYLESLDIRQKQLKEEIENDEELKKMSDAIDFMDSVRKGETVIESVPVDDKTEPVESE